MAATGCWRWHWGPSLPPVTSVGVANVRFGILVLVLWSASPQAPEPNPLLRETAGDWRPDSLRAGFAVRYKNERTRYRVNLLTVLPRGSVRLDIEAASAAARFNARSTAGRVEQRDQHSWVWHAPDSGGPYRIRIVETDTGDSILLNAFVLVPFERIVGELLNGYRVGTYPERALRGLTVYERPRGFIEVTDGNRRTLVSPRLRLEQFLCKQPSRYPKYVVLRERLVLKLEYLLDRVNEAGYPASTFHIMSGYRTPYYNTAIGNVRYSGHVYGLAADIFVDDRPRDGVMDDLNQDGRSDVRDAQILYDLVDRQVGTASYESYLGGLGRYRRTAAHGPFVHVDVRGFKARW